MNPSPKTVIEVIDELVAALWDRDVTPMSDEEFYEKYQRGEE